MFTLIVFLLTVVLSPTGAPSSIVRTVQQTTGFATEAACETDATAKQVAKIPGAVFFMCMGTSSGADQWLIQNWLRVPTTEAPILQNAVTIVPTWFMTLTLSYLTPVNIKLGGFPTIDACNAVRQQLNISPVDPIQFTLSACQQTVAGTVPPPVVTNLRDVLVYACPPHYVAGYLRISACPPYCESGVALPPYLVMSQPCPLLAP